jgi:hypothetical protein
VKSFEEVLQQASGEKRHSNVRGKKKKLTALAEEALTQLSTGEGNLHKVSAEKRKYQTPYKVIPTITNWPRWTTT